MARDLEGQARRRRERYAADPAYRERRLAHTRESHRRRGSPSRPDRHTPEAKRQARSRRRSLKRGAFVEDVHPLVVLERADGECGICGGDVDPFQFDVDHIVPLVRGGLHNYENSQAAHPVCNRRKGAKEAV